MHSAALAGKLVGSFLLGRGTHIQPHLAVRGLSIHVIDATCMPVFWHFICFGEFYSQAVTASGGAARREVWCGTRKP